MSDPKEIATMRRKTFEDRNATTSYFSEPVVTRFWPPDRSQAPLITRQLNQKELHQLVKDLLLNQDLTGMIIVRTKGLDQIYLFRTYDFWSVYADYETVGCKTYACVEEILGPQTIEEVKHVGNGLRPVVVYDDQYPFFRSPDQREVLEAYFPGQEFDYPEKEISETDYLEQLEKENQLLRQTLNQILDKDTSKVVEIYRLQPEDLKRQRFLESKFPNASLIGAYLDKGPK